MKKISPHLLLVILNSCTATTAWQLDSIDAGNKLYNSARLTYCGSPLLHLEYLKMADSIDLKLVSTHSFLSLSRENPPSAIVRYMIDGESPFEEKALLSSGNMRLPLSSDMALRITQALQKGKSIEISVDDLTVTIYPEEFPKIYEKFTRS